MKEKILNVFFPRTCPVCGEVVKGQDKFVCDKCKGKVFYMKEPKCAKCGKSLKEDGTLCKDCREHKHAYEKGVCLFQYAGGIKESMYRFKYKMQENMERIMDGRLQSVMENYLNNGELTA